MSEPRVSVEWHSTVDVAKARRLAALVFGHPAPESAAQHNATDAAHALAGVAEKDRKSA